MVQSDAAAAALLDGARRALLLHLHEPASASELARRLGQPRQRINYHLRELERVGLVHLVEEKAQGNCIERVVAASATSYLISPEALGAIGADPNRIADRGSSAYAAAAAGETIPGGQAHAV